MPINIANAVHLETIVKGESEVLDVDGVRYIWFNVIARFGFEDYGNAVTVSVPVEISDDLTWAQLRQAALDGAKQTVSNALAVNAFGAERRRPIWTKGKS